MEGMCEAQYRSGGGEELPYPLRVPPLYHTDVLINVEGPEPHPVLVLSFLLGCFYSYLRMKQKYD